MSGTEQSIPDCVPCGIRRLVCDRQGPCTSCRDLGISSSCSYDWTLGPHILELFSEAHDWSSRVRIDLRANQPAPLGAFGSVHRVPTAQDGVVAVKVLFPNRGLPPRVLQLSLREAWIWSKLDHRAIVPFLGIADYADVCPGAFPQLCLVSPWMSAGNVVEFLASHEVDRLFFVWDVIRGVEYLHEREDGAIIHGDLKGSNVLVDVDTYDRPTARITDFGLAQITETLQTSFSTSTSDNGNVRWLAFERVFPQKYGVEHLPLAKTTASDVFEMMRTVLEICTGCVPFYEQRHDLAVWKLLDEERMPPPPAIHCIDAQLWQLMVDAWSPDRSQRPSANLIRLNLGPKMLHRWLRTSPTVTILGTEYMGGLETTFPPFPWLPTPPSILLNTLPPAIKGPKTPGEVNYPEPTDQFFSILSPTGWTQLHLRGPEETVRWWMSRLCRPVESFAQLRWLCHLHRLDIHCTTGSYGIEWEDLRCLLDMGGSHLTILRINSPWLNAYFPPWPNAYPPTYPRLRNLSLQGMHSADAVHFLMTYFGSSPVSRLQLDLESAHPAGDCDCKVLHDVIGKCYLNSLAELTITCHSGQEESLRRMLYAVGGLKCLDLTRVGRPGGSLFGILGWIGEIPSPVPPLRVLRICGFRPGDVLNAMHFRSFMGYPIRRLLINKVDIDSSLGVSRPRANASNLQLGVEEIGWFKADIEHPFVPKYGLFWSRKGEGNMTWVPWVKTAGEAEGAVPRGETRWITMMPGFSSL